MTQPDDPTDAKPDPRPRWRRRLMIAAQISLGLGLGLVITELAFAARAQRAFPHVNFYVPDAELAVRLQPGASMAFKLGDNPLSQINVNSHGYRGADWPAPGSAGPELLVIGDSQVFGLGVSDDETFSARLAASTGRTVLNAGVPTYGPLEYLALTRELLEQREVETVVYVLNFLNDPFELERPNLERHAIWDGWAVRIETAPDSIVEFPGRHWLMSQSHAVYAMRRWWHSRDEAWFEAVDRGLPSEGEWSDLLAAAPAPVVEPAPAPAPAPAPSPEPTDARAAEIEALEHALTELDPKIEAAKAEAEEREISYQDRKVIEAKPGGIIRDQKSEAQRNVEVTAALYRKALDRKREYQRALGRERALERERLRLQRELELAQRAPDAAPAPAPAPEPEPEPEPLPSIFDAHFAELRALTEAHGAELVVVLLPFDVQVSSQEWAKYGVEDGPDMAPTLALLDDAGANAARLGITVLDPTQALRDAEPGAFLDADIHMTPKGHAALAEALEATLASLDADARESKSAK